MSPELNLQEVRSYIIRTVEARQGMKGVELAVELAGEFFNSQMTNDAILDVIEELVLDGSILEIEYALPSMPYRVKSFYLPKGTDISINRKGKK